MRGVLMEEAARRLCVSTNQVQRLIRDGRLHVKEHLGSFVFVDQKDLEREVARADEERTQMARIERM